MYYNMYLRGGLGTPGRLRAGAAGTSVATRTGRITDTEVGKLGKLNTELRCLFWASPYCTGEGKWGRM